MENIRGIALMILSMAGFSVADMFVKSVSDRIPVGEVLFVLGFGGAVIFAILARLNGEAIFSRDILSPLILLRSAGEVVGTFGFVTALALTPLSSASTILQAAPLAVTLGAALFLQEAVGWRRWSAIAVGFLGVLIIIRPGLEGFQPASLFAVLSVIGLSVRDLATRAAPKGLSSIRLGTYGFAVLVPVGLGLLAFQGGAVQPDATETLALIAVLVLDVAGYYALTLAMRMGDVAIITPFRYVRIVFAISLGYLAFGETLDGYTAIGAAIIIASGLYTFARERRRRDTA